MMYNMKGLEIEEHNKLKILYLMNKLYHVQVQ